CCGERSRLKAVEVFRHLLALFEANVSFLPVGAIAGELAPAALLALDGAGANTGNLDLEQALNSLFHFGFGGLQSDLEHQGVLRLLDGHALLGDEGAANDGIEGWHLRNLLLRGITALRSCLTAFGNKLLEGLLQGLNGILRENCVLVSEQVVGMNLGAEHEFNTGKVARAKIKLLVELAAALHQ